MPYKSGTWGDDAKNRAKNRTAYFNEYRKKRDKKKIDARAKVFLAIKSGKIKPQACNFFGTDCRGRTEAHHPDYNHPLYVVWLCSFHHRKEHALLSELEKGDKKCLCCSVKIEAPKTKYCSSYCNTKHYRFLKRGIL